MYHEERPPYRNRQDPPKGLRQHHAQQRRMRCSRTTRHLRRNLQRQRRRRKSPPLPLPLEISLRKASPRSTQWSSAPPASVSGSSRAPPSRPILTQTTAPHHHRLILHCGAPRWRISQRRNAISIGISGTRASLRISICVGRGRVRLKSLGSSVLRGGGVRSGFRTRMGRLRARTGSLAGFGCTRGGCRWLSRSGH